jgi:Protein of unknown function (DUF3592)
MENILNSIFLISGKHGAFTGVPPTVMAGFGLVSAALIVLGVYLTQKRRAWYQHSALTQGEIVEVSKRYDRNDRRGQHPMFFPVVSFSVNDRQFKIEADKGVSILSQIGQKMEVRYNPENPYESVLGESNVPGIKPSVFYVLGIGMLLASAVLMFK